MVKSGNSGGPYRCCFGLFKSIWLIFIYSALELELSRFKLSISDMDSTRFYENNMLILKAALRFNSIFFPFNFYVNMDDLLFDMLEFLLCVG